MNEDTALASGDTVDAAALVDRARSMVAALRARAAATEAARRVSRQTISGMIEAGLFRSLQPVCYGGYEHDYGVVIDVGFELSRGCASTGWVYGVLSAGSCIVAKFPRPAQDDVWHGDPDALVAGSFMPTGVTELVDGGYKISGKWGFASGYDNAAWLYLGAKLATGTDEPATDLAFMLLPRSDCRSLDNWNAIGLGGTGSHDVVVEQAFVPEHRVLPISQLRNPSRTDRDASPLYRVPLLSAAQVGLSVAAIGAAQGALDEFLDATRARLTTGALMGAGKRMAEFQNVQSRVGEAMGLIDAARLLLQRDAAETTATVKAGGDVSIEARIRNRRDHAFSVHLAIQAVNRLFEVVGGGGMSKDSAFQRHWRDANAVAKHVSLQWDAVSAMAGQHALGLEPQGHY